MTVKQPLQVRLSSDHLGLGRIEQSPPGSIELATELLQKNHDSFHMCFRDVGGHNHLVHAVLTTLAMGGDHAALKRAYGDNDYFQRPIPALEKQDVKSLADPDQFLSRMVNLAEYRNFLAFFDREVETKGWQAAINEYCFSDSPVAEPMLFQLYEGLFHPLIHLGFGVEFAEPGVVAEGLAQAAAHSPGRTLAPFFTQSDQLARSGAVPAKPLMELYKAARDDSTIRGSARLQDGPLREQGVLQRAGDELARVAAGFQVRASDVDRATAELMSCAAFTAAAQRPGKQRTCDFFYLHLVTSALFFAAFARADWLRPAARARLLELKGRADLVWYAACGAAEMQAEVVREYEPTASRGMDWRALYEASNTIQDDGHITKFIRALKVSEEWVKPFERGPDAAALPVTGDMWLKIAQICYDSTSYIVGEDPAQRSKKWVFGAGMDPAWLAVPDLESK